MRRIAFRQSALHDWKAPFRSVAPAYQPSHLGWCRMIERDGSRLTPHASRRVIAAAPGGWIATSRQNGAA